MVAAVTWEMLLWPFKVNQLVAMPAAKLSSLQEVLAALWYIPNACRYALHICMPCYHACNLQASWHADHQGSVACSYLADGASIRQAYAWCVGGIDALVAPGTEK